MNFSPSGDYFTSAGNDANVMIWKSNLNDTELELIDDFGGKTHNVVPGAVPDKVEENKDLNKKNLPSNFHDKCHSKLVSRTSTDVAAGVAKTFQFE